MSASYGLFRDLREAVWAFLRCRFRWRLLCFVPAVQHIRTLHDEEYAEGHNQEIDDNIDELSVGNDGNSGFLRLGKRHGRDGLSVHDQIRIERNEQILEVHAAQQLPGSAA